ncbi:YqcI/YcgG family protein [Streptomyces goshikiensis]|uniref:YqcI/YcgG family protein n=1 Tax=Streptomyces goshikiensis TaxID=1942 RepID=UPI0036B41A59
MVSYAAPTARVSVTSRSRRVNTPSEGGSSSCPSRNSTGVPLSPHLWAGSDLPPLLSEDGPFGWVPDAYDTFVARLLGTDPAYPCSFGVTGQQRGNNSFSAVDTRHPGTHGVKALADSLHAYRERAWRGPKRQSLVVFVGPAEPGRSLADDHGRFWELLAELSTYDTEPWPNDVPRDPSDPDWQWCFASEPWFVFAASPAHRARRSRDLGPCLTLVFQVRRVFDGIGGSTVAGKAAKRRVREGLRRYDLTDVHPSLGDGEHSTDFKWRQYALQDDGTTPAAGACPYPYGERPHP